MKPGKILDAVIASKVMGYKLKQEDCNSYWVDDIEDEPTHGHDYSTDIQDAWQIVELLSDDYEFKLFGPRLTHKGTTLDWECELVNRTTKAWWSSEGESAAHAICLVALKVVKTNEGAI